MMSYTDDELSSIWQRLTDGTEHDAYDELDVSALVSSRNLAGLWARIVTNIDVEQTLAFSASVGAVEPCNNKDRDSTIVSCTRKRGNKEAPWELWDVQPAAACLSSTIGGVLRSAEPTNEIMVGGTLAMKIDDPKIVALRQKVTAAQQEFDMAVTFHEVWKAAAYDQDLHSRLGKSYASQAFLITRTALRREMLLALIRLWDTNKQSIRMESIAATLQEKEVIDTLVLDRVNRLGLPEAINEMRNDLGKKADEVVLLIHEYMEGGTHQAVLKNLRTLRHERLAHRQIASATATGANTTDEEIERFYQDNSKLIRILLGVVNAMGYDPEDTAKVFGFYASHFWGRFQKTEVKHDSKSLSV